MSCTFYVIISVMLFHRKKVAPTTSGTEDLHNNVAANIPQQPSSSAVDNLVSPAGLVNPSNPATSTQVSSGQASPPEAASKGLGTHTRILIVDDDEMIRIFLRDIFWIHGNAEDYDVQVSGTLEEAEKFITDPEKVPDIVFLDLMVPPSIRAGVASPSHIEGTFEFIKKFKKDPKFSRMRIVVFSGHRDKDIKEKAMSSGADDYLVKGDFMPKEIISFVEKINNKK